MSLAFDLRRELEALIASETPIQAIPAKLRSLQRMGFTRQGVQSLFESIRGETVDEVVDDRILEILDIVTGFCRVEDRVWED